MNAKRREDMVSVLPKKRILMRHGKSQENQDTTTYTITLDHNIQSTVQGMIQALRAGEHLCCVMDSGGCSPDWRMQFYVSPYAHTRSMLDELRRCFLKKSVRGQDFGNFQVEERMKVIKEIRERFRRFFYQEKNFNFSLLEGN